MLRLQTAVGSDLTETDRAFRKAETILLARPEIDRVFAIVGGFGSGVNGGVVFVTLVPPEQRQLTQQQFQGLLRRDLNAIPG